MSYETTGEMLAMTVIHDAPLDWPAYYFDRGCEVSPSCLSCPLPTCKHDDPLATRRLQRRESDIERVAVMDRDGLSEKEAAMRFDVAVRTVQRMVARVRLLANLTAE